MSRQTVGSLWMLAGAAVLVLVPFPVVFGFQALPARGTLTAGYDMVGVWVFTWVTLYGTSIVAIIVSWLFWSWGRTLKRGV